MKVLLLTLVVALAFGSAATASAAEKEKEKKAKTVTLDVKDADVIDVLRSMQKQCGIKNMVIDKDVAGKATFLFRKVPCDQAFGIVFRTYGLAAQFQQSSVVTIGARKP